MVARLSRILNEGVMGFLALVALALALLPELFTLSEPVHSAIDTAEWVIVAVFAVEYVVGLLAAERKPAYLRSPWRILILATIVFPLVSLLPDAGESWRSTPALRLLRLARAVLFGARAGALRGRAGGRRTAKGPSGPVQVRRDRQTRSWDEFLATPWPGRSWTHVANLDGPRMDAAAAAAKISPVALQSALVRTAYPRIEPAGDAVLFSLSMPSFAGEIERTPILAVARGEGFLTLSSGDPDLSSLETAPSFSALLRLVLRKYEQVSGLVETQVRELEEEPVRGGAKGFFERTFRLKRELFALKADLWRLRGILEAVAEGRTALPAVAAAERENFRPLAEDAAYAHDTVEEIRESLLSLIELHLNVVSFDMNRGMRILAIVSVLGLIPAVAGGLFGMNLIGNPWPITLPQVTFVVSFAMLLFLYVFYIRGWLR